jgi:proline iminopeptidase
MTTGIIPVDGFELGYSDEGAGRAVLVIGSSVYYPRTFSPQLRKHLRLVFVDHRGFGTPTKQYLNADFELDKLVDDIEKIRAALQLEEVIVAGHSGHGYMALAYAQKYPQNVSHVALLALSPDSSEASFKAADRYLEESVAPERKARLATDMAQLAADIDADPNRRFIHYSLRSGARIWYDHTYDARHLWEGVQVVPEMFDYVWGEVFRKLDITNGIEILDRPVFLALGRYDYWNPPHLWEAVRHKFRDLTIRVFECSGHTPQSEQADDFDRELLAWLAEKP